MSVLAIPDDSLYKLRKDIRKTRPLTRDEIEELQGLSVDSLLPTFSSRTGTTLAFGVSSP